MNQIWPRLHIFESFVEFIEVHLEITIAASKHQSNILIMANYFIDIPEALVIFVANFYMFWPEKLWIYNMLIASYNNTRFVCKGSVELAADFLRNFATFEVIVLSKWPFDQAQQISIATAGSVLHLLDEITTFRRGWNAVVDWNNKKTK